MKKITLLICFLLSLGRLEAQHAAPTSADFRKLDWLEGSWIRTNPKPGRSGLEKWAKISTTEWKGQGLSIHEKDTTQLEGLRLIIKDGSIYYAAVVPENQSEVLFKFVEIGPGHFVCENPTHDFPKKIAYTLEGSTLKATISGDGKAIDYLFKKK
jgi:Domain of unknown function (DUF6265)